MVAFRLFYVTISTPNLERAIEWYQDKLNYKVFIRKDFPEFGTRIAVLEQFNFRLELLEQANSIPFQPPRNEPPDHTNVQGLSQFAILVDDLDQAIAELTAKGVETLWVKRVDEILRLSFQFIKDCDGNLIQLVELMDDAKAHLQELSKNQPI